MNLDEFLNCIAKEFKLDDIRVTQKIEIFLYCSEKTDTDRLNSKINEYEEKIRQFINPEVRPELKVLEIIKITNDENGVKNEI